MKPLDPNYKPLPLEELVKKYPENNGLKLLLSRQMAAQPMEGEKQPDPNSPETKKAWDRLRGILTRH